METQELQSQSHVVPQHLRALERANLVRRARAELKRAIARDELDAAEVVRDPPWEAEGMTVEELLTSQRRWGRTRSRKFLLPLSLNGNKQLGTLSARQRALLLESLLEKRNAAVHSSRSQRAEPDHGEGSLWDELENVSRRSNELSGELSRLTQRRDELIRSLSEAGASRRAVAQVAALTVGRVQQILNEPAKS